MQNASSSVIIVVYSPISNLTKKQHLHSAMHVNSATIIDLPSTLYNRFITSMRQALEF